MPRILLVEDNANAKLAYAIALRRLGFEVQTAPDGQEALELFRKEGADLVITDYKMPRLDGQQLVFRLHGLAPNLPVLLISAFEAAEVMEKFASENRVYFLSKPFSAVQLKSTIDRIFHENETAGD